MREPALLTPLTVQPKLAVVSSNIALQGLVKSIFANPTYMERQCITPLTTYEDEIAGNTCLQIKYAYQATSDLQNYFDQWEPFFLNGSYLLDRPSPVTQFHENNTRVVSSWLGVDDTKQNSERYGRIVNNVTLAVPHIGVGTAARDSRNGILQLEVNLK